VLFSRDGERDRAEEVWERGRKDSAKEAREA
jgi:hypothetical protein